MGWGASYNHQQGLRIWSWLRLCTMLSGFQNDIVPLYILACERALIGAKEFLSELFLDTVINSESFIEFVSLFSSSVVLINAAFLCYKQMNLFIQDYQIVCDQLFAYEKFGVLFNLPRSFTFGQRWTGLPVRVRRDFTSAIGIRKAGHGHSIYITSERGRENGCVLLFLWESRCEDCVCWGMTLKCNTWRAGLDILQYDKLSTIRFRLLCWGRRFTFFFPQVSNYISPFELGYY